MTDVRDVALLLSKQRTTKQDRDPLYRGEIVEMRNAAGQDSIHVDNRPLYVWVRLWSTQGSVVPCYNERVAAIAGLPVWVSRRTGSINELEIIGIDVEILQSQDDPNTGLIVPTHHEAHEWPDAGPGIDPITVYPRSWSQLKTYPQNPLSTSVDVSPLRHQAASAIVVFNGGTVALAAAIGALAANEARLVLVYLDTSTNTLATANGAIGTIADGWTLAEPTIPADDAYLSAVIRIYNGQTEIDEFDIRDRRFFLNPVPGTISNVKWANVWVVAASGGDFTTIVTAVADARVVNGDVLFICPGTYAGFTTAKDLSFISLSPYNYANNTGNVTINTATTFSDAGGGQIVTLYGIEFTATVTVDYDPALYALSCEFTGSPAVQDGANSSPGFLVFDLCYMWAADCIDLTNGTGMDIDLRVCHIAGNVNVGANTVILWSHYQASGTITAGTITRDDAPHIEWAAFGTNVLVVGYQGAQYGTVAGAIAAPPGANDLVWIQNGTWACNNQTLPGGANIQGASRESTILAGTTNVLTLSVGATSSYVADLTITNSQSSVAAIYALYVSDIAEIRDVIATGTNTNAGAAAHAYGFAILGEATSCRLVDCDGTGASTGGNGYGLYIGNAGAGGVAVVIEGGTYDGNTADIFCDASCTIELRGPYLANGTITGTGTVTGYWYDTDGNLRTAYYEHRVVECVWPDLPLQDRTEGNHFRDNTATFPAGWTQTDAPAGTNTNSMYSFWFIKGSDADVSYDYRLQTGIDLENDIPANRWAAFQWGPVFFRHGVWAADVDYWFAIHGETAAAIDLLEYVRVHLQWNNAGAIWRIRGESRAGAADVETASAWQTLDDRPIHQPLYFRLVFRNLAAKTTREYWGASLIPRGQQLFQSIGEPTTWGQLYWRINQTRGGAAGVEDYLYIGAIDYWYDNP